MNEKNQACSDSIDSTESEGLLMSNELVMSDELVRPNEIKITALDYGYMVKVGCQSFAIESTEKMIKNLEAYLNDPRGVEKKWNEKKELL